MRNFCTLSSFIRKSGLRTKKLILFTLMLFLLQSRKDFYYENIWQNVILNDKNVVACKNKQLLYINICFK